LEWSETIDIDCDNPYVHGGPYGMAADRVLTITERADYTFSTTAEGGVISACRDVDHFGLSRVVASSRRSI
jgi:hypothetical protein